MGAVCSDAIKLCGKPPDDPDEVVRRSQIMCVKKHQKSMEDFRRTYKLTDTVLGQGSFGKVILAESVLNPAMKFSVKVVSKELLAGNLDHFREVYQILKTINHHCILKYYDFFENETNFYLVMELFEGQQLLDVIISKAGNTKG